MKVAIQGLGENPVSIELVLKKERPDVTYIICSNDLLKHVAFNAGYTRPNEEFIKTVAKRTNTRVVFEKCDIFSPESVTNAIRRVMGRVRDEDVVVINYTSGTAVMRLLLGLLGVFTSMKRPTKILYAVKYRDGIGFTADHTKALKGIFEEFAKFL